MKEIFKQKKITLASLTCIATVACMATSCTLSMIQTDTHGSATDVVDDDPSTSVQARADVQVPLKPL